MALSITLPLVISVEPADIFVAEGHSLTCTHAGQEAGHPGLCRYGHSLTRPRVPVRLDVGPDLIELLFDIRSDNIMFSISMIRLSE